MHHMAVAVYHLIMHHMAVAVYHLIMHHMAVAVYHLIMPSLKKVLPAAVVIQLDSIYLQGAAAVTWSQLPFQLHHQLPQQHGAEEQVLTAAALILANMPLRLLCMLQHLQYYL
jgi:hypothetical protein